MLVRISSILFRDHHQVFVYWFLSHALHSLMLSYTRYSLVLIVCTYFFASLSLIIRIELWSVIIRTYKSRWIYSIERTTASLWISIKNLLSKFVEISQDVIRCWCVVFSRLSIVVFRGYESRIERKRTRRISLVSLFAKLFNCRIWNRKIFFI